MSHPSILDLSQAIDEIKEKVSQTENPSKEYKDNLEKAIQDVKDKILSIGDVFENIKEEVKSNIEQVFSKVEELTKTVEEFNTKTIFSVTEEFKEKLSKSIEELKTKFEQLKDPAESNFDSFVEELNSIRQQIFSINNPLEDVKKVAIHNILDTINSDDQLKTKFAKNVLNVSHPEDFVFPPEQIEAIPSVTTIKINWETVKFADTYKVFIAKAGEANYKQLQDTSYTTVTIPGLTPDTEYNIYIIASKESGQLSSSSKIVSAKTLSNK